MAKIEFYMDSDGSKQVHTFINDLKLKANSNHDIKHLYMFVLHGLEFLKKEGVEHAKNHLSVLSRDDGTAYTIRLIKDLIGYSPLLEFRINWVEVGAVRIIFFEYTHREETYFVLMRAVLKQSTTDIDFIRARNECKQLLPGFYLEPKKYINIE